MPKNILYLTEIQFLGYLMHEVKKYAEEYGTSAIQALNDVLSKQFYYSEKRY